MAISSLTNHTVRRVRRLRKKAWRERRRQLLLEGKRALSTALDAGIAPSEVLFTEGGERDRELLERAKQSGAKLHTVTTEVMEHLTDLRSAPSVLSVAPLIEARLEHLAGSSALVLQDVRDPATLGGIMAVGAATGVQAAVVCAGSADPFAPKVVRAAGAVHYLIQVVRNVEADEAMKLLSADATCVTIADHGPAPWEADLAGRLILSIGTGQGSLPLCVPAIASVAPPLTASVAVVLYEWLKQGRDAR